MIGDLRIGVQDLAVCTEYGVCNSTALPCCVGGVSACKGSVTVVQPDVWHFDRPSRGVEHRSGTSVSRCVPPKCVLPHTARNAMSAYSEIEVAFICSAPRSLAVVTSTTRLNGSSRIQASLDRPRDNIINSTCGGSVRACPAAWK